MILSRERNRVQDRSGNIASSKTGTLTIVRLRQIPRTDGRLNRVKHGDFPVAYHLFVRTLVPRLYDAGSFLKSVQCNDVRAVDVREQVVVGADVSAAVIMIMAFVTTAVVVVVMIVRHTVCEWQVQVGLPEKGQI